MAIIRGGWGFPWERTPDQWLNTNTQVHSEIQTGMQIEIMNTLFVLENHTHDNKILTYVLMLETQVKLFPFIILNLVPWKYFDIVPISSNNVNQAKTKK